MCMPKIEKCKFCFPFSPNIFTLNIQVSFTVELFDHVKLVYWPLGVVFQPPPDRKRNMSKDKTNSCKLFPSFFHEKVSIALLSGELQVKISQESSRSTGMILKFVVTMTHYMSWKCWPETNGECKNFHQRTFTQYDSG